MAANSIVEIVRYLGRIERVRDAENQTDRQLLDRFLRNKDDVALETLVRRYAPMVWGVCRRTVFNHHDAEDAFQATFYVFVRKAASLRTRKSVAGWLHVAAHKTAQKARQMTRRRFERERRVTVMPEPEARTTDQTNGSELKDLLDDALSQLPERYRSVVVLCDLQEKTRPQAARQLGLPEGTVGSRLARGRALLAKRLAGRGLAVSSAALGALLSKQTVSAAVPGPLLSSTIRVAGLLAAGDGAGAISAQVSTLVKGVLKAMVIAKQRTAILVLLLVGLVPSGGLLAHHVLTIGNVAPDGTDTMPAAPAEEVGEILPRALHNEQVWDVALSADGRFAISIGRDQTLKAWNVATGEQLWQKEGQAGDQPGVALSPDGQTAFAGNDHCVRCWNMATGEEGAPLRAPMGRVRSVVVSRDGRKLLAGGTMAVVLWDLQSGKVIRKLDNCGYIHCAALSPDCERIITGGESTLYPPWPRTPLTRLWDVKTGKEIGRFVGHTDRINCLDFSPDGRLAVSGSFDKTVRIWDVATQRELQKLPHGELLEHVMFHPDGQRVLSACADNVLYLWAAAAAHEIHRFEGHTAPIMSFDVSRDGRYALTGSRDGTVRRWRLPDPESQASHQITAPEKDKATLEKEAEDGAAMVLEAIGAKLTRDDNLPGRPVVEVQLTGNKQLNDTILWHVKDFKRLNGLYIGRTGTTDAGLEHLQNLKSLRVLDLGTTQVTDAGMKHLAKLDGLLSLCLVSTRVTDSGLKDLKGLKGVRYLLLQATGVSDAGVKEIREALPQRDVRK
jgi:RNA polymerase sigma factor (sigma-70 family)